MAPDSIKGPLGIDERRMLVFAHQCGGPDGSLFGVATLPLQNLYKYRGGRRDTAATKVPIGPFSRFPHERTWRQPGKLYSARKSPGGRAAACWQNKGQGQGHGPPNAKFAAIRRCLRGLLISYPPYHMCINTVLGQVMFQIAGFESHGSSQSHIIDNLG
uniref:Uncharacterized protein n=1 Tax=Pyricularia oryzae (strain 70-15 / ATCC MYA-4617 / FGSC 8958) TaxID=242507 RepID=Q2KGC8_PYRO7|nr:hypothetical protein MGCH7_ch7g407 [Pyricularia oryzae 70-15]